jgi:molybdenum cofactor biosynthesis enzyme
MAKLTLQEFIEGTSSGKIFSVTFIKRTDGAIRTMQCRRGVTKGVTGVGLAFNPQDYALLGVYDMAKKNLDAEGNMIGKGAFRFINLEQLLTLKYEGQEYDWNQAQQCFETADEA